MGVCIPFCAPGMRVALSGAELGAAPEGPMDDSGGWYSELFSDELTHIKNAKSFNATLQSPERRNTRIPDL